MDTYDVLIVGAGPAGCQCARELTVKGYTVLLVEKVTDFSKNNFSSAGSIVKLVKDYDLPNDVIASCWNTLRVVTSQNTCDWDSKDTLGVVLDFYKLRTFLVGEGHKTKKLDVLMSTIVEHIDSEDVVLKNISTNTIKKVKARVIVDATGPAQNIIRSSAEDSHIKTATGIEYIIELKPGSEKKAHQNILYFFLGKRWVPSGYSWIFAMDNNSYKVGSGRYNYGYEDQRPLTEYVDVIIHDYLELSDSEYTIQEKHGSTIKLDPHGNQLFYKDNIIAIGDAIYGVNPLGGEGIRHGMYSARIAAESIDKYLKGDKDSFMEYAKAMKIYFGSRWKLSYIFSQAIYRYWWDIRIDWSFKIFKRLNTKEMIDLLFGYDFKYIYIALRRFIFRTSNLNH